MDVLGHLRRWGWLFGIVLVAAGLAACGGGSAENSAAAESVPQATQAVSAPQATDEPLAARVNGQPITMAAFERERQRRLQGLEAQPATQAAFDAAVLDAMIDQVLIEQAAPRLGITVSDAEVDAELALQEELAAANGTTLEDMLAAQLYTLDEYRDVLRGLLLAQKVGEVVADVPPTAEQVHARHILVADEATARDLIAQLQQGADFAQLAMEYSLDASSAPSGGDLGWVPRGVLLQPEVEDAIFALAEGELAPEPVRSSLGYHVVQTLERVQDRPLSQALLAERKQRAFQEWLAVERENAVIERYIGTP